MTDVKSFAKDPAQLAKAAIKEERARDAALAMREAEAEALAIRAKTLRLRALRLALEAKQAGNSPPKVSRKTT